MTCEHAWTANQMTGGELPTFQEIQSILFTSGSYPETLDNPWQNRFLTPGWVHVLHEHHCIACHAGMLKSSQ